MLEKKIEIRLPNEWSGTPSQVKCSRHRRIKTKLMRSAGVDFSTHERMEKRYRISRCLSHMRRERETTKIIIRKKKNKKKKTLCVRR